MDAHLTSIKSRQEMLFVHNILLEAGITSDSVYIGEWLQDVSHPVISLFGVPT